MTPEQAKRRVEEAIQALAIEDNVEVLKLLVDQLNSEQRKEALEVLWRELDDLEKAVFIEEHDD